MRPRTRSHPSLFSPLLILCVLFLVNFLVCVSAQDIALHSLKPPYGIQYWALGGDAHLTDNLIRLAEDRQSKKGSFWNTIPCDLNEWEVTFQYRIHGVSKVGADGMAFWYTEASQRSGDLFGNQPIFKGLGIIIDTYDNDRTGKHPYLSVLVSDGAHGFEHDHADHGSSVKKTGIEKGGCSIAARNLREPSTVRITYSRGTLTVAVDVESLGTPRPCVQILNVPLPKGYYFGFSAATGHLADNHDLHSFTVRNLDYSNPYVPPTPQVQGDSNLARLVSNLQRDISYTTKDTSEKILNGQQEITTKIEQLNALVRQLSGGGVSQGYQQGRGVGGSDPDCSALTGSINNVLKTLERIDKDQYKRFSELRSAIQIPPPVNTGINWSGWLTLLFVIILLILQVTAFVITKNERRKSFF